MIAVSLVGISLVVHYQKTGEVLQISWRKASAKITSPSEATPPPQTRFVNGTVTNEILPIQEVTVSVSSTNFLNKTINQNIISPNPASGLDDSKKNNATIVFNKPINQKIDFQSSGRRLDNLKRHGGPTRTNGNVSTNVVWFWKINRKVAGVRIAFP